MRRRYCKVCDGWHDMDEPWPHNCLPPRPLRADLATPMIVRDIPEYLSPIDGRPITSRSWRREDLKKNDCVPWEKGMGGRFSEQQRTPGVIHNPKYEGRGLPLSEKGQERKEKQRKEARERR